MIDLHDYSIIGCKIDGRRTITLLLLDPPGICESKLVLQDVVNLFVDGLGLQNVIMDTKMFRGREDSFEYRRACELLDIDSADDAILGERRTLLFIEASVGAEIACLLDGRPELSLVRLT